MLETIRLGTGRHNFKAGSMSAWRCWQDDSFRHRNIGKISGPFGPMDVGILFSSEQKLLDRGSWIELFQKALHLRIRSS